MEIKLKKMIKLCKDKHRFDILEEPESGMRYLTDGYVMVQLESELRCDAAAIALLNGVSPDKLEDYQLNTLTFKESDMFHYRLQGYEEKLVRSPVDMMIDGVLCISLMSQSGILFIPKEQCTIFGAEDHFNVFYLSTFRGKSVVLITNDDVTVCGMVIPIIHDTKKTADLLSEVDSSAQKAHRNLFNDRGSHQMTMDEVMEG